SDCAHIEGATVSAATAKVNAIRRISLLRSLASLRHIPLFGPIHWSGRIFMRIYHRRIRRCLCPFVLGVVTGLVSGTAVRLIDAVVGGDFVLLILALTLTGRVTLAAPSIRLRESQRQRQ